MQLYFEPQLCTEKKQIVLDANTSKHLIQVLRMQEGEQVELTNGRGISAIATITIADKKKCTVSIENIVTHTCSAPELTIAVSFTKNRSRNEWMLEKLTEIGVQHILPILTQRTEKDKFNIERMNAIIVAAMIQSKQYFLPTIAAPIALKKIDFSQYEQKLFAHCDDDTAKQYLNALLTKEQETLMLIGPEGDFTPEEIDFLKRNKLQSVSLGTRRLRTETAAIYAAVIFNIKNDA